VAELFTLLAVWLTLKYYVFNMTDEVSD